MDRNRFIAVLHPSVQTGKILIPLFTDNLPVHYTTEQIINLTDLHSPKFSVVVIFQPEKFYANLPRIDLEKSLVGSKKGVILLTGNKLNFIQRLPNLIILDEEVSMETLVDAILIMEERRNRFFRFIYRYIQKKTLKTIKM